MEPKITHTVYSGGIHGLVIQMPTGGWEITASVRDGNLVSFELERTQSGYGNDKPVSVLVRMPFNVSSQKWQKVTRTDGFQLETLFIPVDMLQPLKSTDKRNLW